MLRALKNWFGGTRPARRAARVSARPKLRPRLGVEQLESREVPSGTTLAQSFRLTGDINGDGRTDLVLVGQDWEGPGLNTRQFLSNGNGTYLARGQVLGDGASVLSTPPLLADADGDGRADLIFRFYDPSRGLVVRTALAQPNGTFAPTVESVLGDGASVLSTQTLAGDLSGDRRADLVFTFYDPSRGLVVRTSLAQPGGIYARTVDSVLGDGSSVLSTPPLLADADGDGRPDLIFRYFDLSRGVVVRTALAQPNGTFAPTVESVLDGSTLLSSPWLNGDVSGDRRADLVFVSYDPSRGLVVRTSLAQPVGTYAPTVETADWVQGDGAAVLSTAPRLADVNGDGRPDLIFRFSDPSRGLVVGTSLARGDGTFAPTVERVLGDGPAVLNVPTLVGDVSGDGLADLIFMGTGYDCPGLSLRTRVATNGGWGWALQTSNWFDWFDMNLADPAVRDLTRSKCADGRLDRSDMLSIFSQVGADGVVSSAELASLQTLVASGVILNEPSYVQNLAYKVVMGDPANAHYLGGALPASGILSAGSRAWVLQDLVNKWFLGLDRPTSWFARIVKGQTQLVGANYMPATGTLFVGIGPTYQDVFQGNLGDCTLLASLAEAAARSTSIRGMFIANGDNTWTLRFYHNGSPEYITVDNQLPENAGVTVFDHPSSGALWAALAEKAYAQLNESGWLGTLRPGVNSYWALDVGNANTLVTALTAITDRPAADADINPTAIGSALALGQLVVLGTAASTGHPNILHDHAYAIVGYNPSASQPFTLFNPWGINGGTDALTGNFIWGQFTCSGAALSKYFSDAVSTLAASPTTTPPRASLTAGFFEATTIGSLPKPTAAAPRGQRRNAETRALDPTPKRHESQVAHVVTSQDLKRTKRPAEPAGFELEM
jgi:hypothetical protein